MECCFDLPSWRAIMAADIAEYNRARLTPISREATTAQDSQVESW
jgi:hypothetical protein